MSSQTEEREAFLGGTTVKAFPVSNPKRIFTNPRYLKTIGFAVAVVILFGYILSQFGQQAVEYFEYGAEDENGMIINLNPRLHVVIPASHPGANLCKNTLGLAILGYPDPTLLGWNEEFSNPDQMDGGSHITTKITRGLEYLEKLSGQEHENDLVLFADAYDVWFQLPPSVLISRYFQINRDAENRLIRNLGRRPMRVENIQQSIIFGASKACRPNEKHTIACYPIPEAPTPGDLYGNDTDVFVGADEYAAFRQRYLDSGYILGPVHAMLPLFRRAQQLVVTTTDQREDIDDGTGASAFLYHGSASAVFATILGQQEYEREVIRRRHRSWFKKFSPAVLPGSVDGVPFSDIIDPPFTHEELSDLPAKGHPYEFGLGVDYYSDLGHSTFASAADARFLVFDGVKTSDAAFAGLACAARLPHGRSSIAELAAAADDLGSVPATLPPDILASPRFSDSDVVPGWAHRSLHTHLCLGTVPVLVHHNGDKAALEAAWPKLWYQPAARTLLRQVEASAAAAGGQGTWAEHITSSRGASGGAWSDKGEWLGWREMCTSPEIQLEVFRDDAVSGSGLAEEPPQEGPPQEDPGFGPT